MTESTRKPKPVRLTMRLAAAIGIGLGLAAVWWKYSDVLLDKFIGLQEGPMEADFFKIVSTLAVFFFGSVWAFKNLRWINDWLAEKTGIGMTTDERRELRRTTDDGTTIVIKSNTESSNTDGL